MLVIPKSRVSSKCSLRLIRLSLEIETDKWLGKPSPTILISSSSPLFSSPHPVFSLPWMMTTPSWDPRGSPRLLLSSTHIQTPRPLIPTSRILLSISILWPSSGLIISSLNPWTSLPAGCPPCSHSGLSKSLIQPCCCPCWKPSECP